MKPEKQRIKIAEACGWKRTPKYDGKGASDTAFEKDNHIVYRTEFPDYLNDLNAMQSAIMSKPRKFRLNFETIMDNYCARSGKLWCELSAQEYANVFLQVEPE